MPFLPCASQYGRVVDGIEVEHVQSATLVIVRAISDDFRTHVRDRLAEYCYGATTVSEDTNSYSFEKTGLDSVDGGGVSDSSTLKQNLRRNRLPRGLSKLVPNRHMARAMRQIERSNHARPTPAISVATMTHGPARRSPRPSEKASAR